ncbi:sulfatase [Caulobacter mirabilis]|uniref:Sulfatase n=2 Tax=Caulobacter mirabilis TaxID=69666 RepID=A0A2D2B3X6_9CAUL|nr:sulfatase [Caulobacter mirabilis]
MRRRDLLLAAGAAALPGLATAASARRPNIVLIVADDLGWGDLGGYGARLIRTPRLDRMAREGARLTAAYASANICTPSRAGLLTGRYPIRTGLAWDVVRQSDTVGLPPSEITLAEMLKPDYATALVGKWHLGHVAPYWPPTVQGFDLFYGLPYSHDMKPLALYAAQAPGVELTREDVDSPRLTQRFFDRGLAFVETNRARPFFLMLALTAPHVPLEPNPDHPHRSPAGAYGDVVEEIDAGVGRLLDRLKTFGLDRDTLVIVTSDNGPWFEGSAGPWRERKGGSGWEGGFRVPFVARHPGVIPAGIVSDAPSMNIDLLPTLAAWTGSPLPAVTLDGRDISTMLKRRGAPSPHEALLLFDNEAIAGIRAGRWKYLVRSYYRTDDLPLDAYDYGLLFDMTLDPGETYNLAARHPEVLAGMKARLATARAEFGPLAKGPRTRRK